MISQTRNPLESIWYPDVKKYGEKYVILAVVGNQCHLYDYDYLADEKIAVAGKPCDAKAINELVKRHRIDGDKIITVGLNCGGTVKPEVAQEMIEKFYKVDPSKVVKEEIDKVIWRNQRAQIPNIWE